ncbi:hypothetical protein K2X05_04980, partial [bacterium]|nr:hypothetical protein [bacterium]
LRKVANSDLHRAEQIRSWKTSFHCPKNIESIKASLLQQNIDFKYFEPQKQTLRLPVLAQNITKLA